MRLLVISGGQTGVDRAALDAALEAGVPATGWCPAGRWAEDGPVPPRYPLRETTSADPAVRTRRNVGDADALLVLAARPAGGTAVALAHARALGRPVLVIDPEDEGAAGRVTSWLRGLAPDGALRLNVAGPRESECPGAYASARRVLDVVLAAGVRRRL